MTDRKDDIIIGLLVIIIIMQVYGLFFGQAPTPTAAATVQAPPAATVQAPARSPAGSERQSASPRAASPTGR